MLIADVSYSFFLQTADCGDLLFLRNETNDNCQKKEVWVSYIMKPGLHVFIYLDVWFENVFARWKMAK